MIRRFLRKRFDTLANRILAVFIIQALITLALLGGVAWVIFEDKTERKLPILVEDYIERLLQDLPSPLTAEAVSALNLPLHFALQSHSQWTFFTEQPQPRQWFRALHKLHEKDWHPFKQHPQWQWQFNRGDFWMRLPYPTTSPTAQTTQTLWLHWSFREGHDKKIGALVALGVIFGMLLLTYFWVRKLLSPIQQLQQGAKRFAQGDFEHRLPIQGANDLSRTHETLNEMAAEIASRLQKEHQLFIAMSHELRTPLARMRLAIEMLEDNDLKTRMLRSHQAMDDLIRALLLREKTQHIADHPVNETIQLVTLVESVLQTHFAEARQNGQDFHLKLPTEAKVDSDPFALTLILKNLMANAIQYGEGQPIEIGCDFTAHSTSTVKSLWVEDRGIGLSETQQSHLFEPFYRADEARSRQSGGLGLGLYLTQGLAKQLHLTLSVKSQPNQGSRFTVHF